MKGRAAVASYMLGELFAMAPAGVTMVPMLGAGGAVVRLFASGLVIQFIGAHAAEDERPALDLLDFDLGLDVTASRAVIWIGLILVAALIAIMLTHLERIHQLRLGRRYARLAKHKSFEALLDDPAADQASFDPSKFIRSVSALLALLSASSQVLVLAIVMFVMRPGLTLLFAVLATLFLGPVMIVFGCRVVAATADQEASTNSLRARSSGACTVLSARSIIDRGRSPQRGGLLAHKRLRERTGRSGVRNAGQPATPPDPRRLILGGWRVGVDDRPGSHGGCWKSGPGNPAVLRDHRAVHLHRGWEHRCGNRRVRQVRAGRDAYVRRCRAGTNGSSGPTSAAFEHAHELLEIATGRPMTELVGTDGLLTGDEAMLSAAVTCPAALTREPLVIVGSMKLFGVLERKRRSDVFAMLAHHHLILVGRGRDHLLDHADCVLDPVAMVVGGSSLDLHEDDD